MKLYRSTCPFEIPRVHVTRNLTHSMVGMLSEQPLYKHDDQSLFATLTVPYQAVVRIWFRRGGGKYKPKHYMTPCDFVWAR